jgi:hypothetical protein
LLLAPHLTGIEGRMQLPVLVELKRPRNYDLLRALAHLLTFFQGIWTPFWRGDYKNKSGTLANGVFTWSAFKPASTAAIPTISS